MNTVAKLDSFVSFGVLLNTDTFQYNKVQQLKFTLLT